LEKAGKVTVGFVAQRFESDWKATARAFATPQLPYLIFPTTLAGIPPARVEEYVDQRTDELIRLLTAGEAANGANPAGSPLPVFPWSVKR